MPIKFLTETATKHLLIVMFLMAGGVLTGIKWLFFDTELIQPEDTAWKITLAARVDINNGSTVIQITRPRTDQKHKLISQRYYHPGLKSMSKSFAPVRTMQVMATRSGITELIVEYHVQIIQSTLASTNPVKDLTTEQREDFLQSTPEINLSLPSLLTLNDFLRRDVTSKPVLVQKIFKQVEKPLTDRSSKFDDLNEIIEANKATSIGRSRLMVALCRLNQIPARVVTGFIMEETNNGTPHYWVETFDESIGWLAFDPENGYEKELPNNYITFNYDTPSPILITNGKLISAKNIIQEDLDILNVTQFEQEKDIWDIFDLRRLDIDTRTALMKILILPFCVLLTAFFRHVLGFFPYGTFTASLLALAMIYADPGVTLTVATIVIALALAGRSVLPKTCPRSPRLSLIFTFVALSMVFSVSLLSYFSIDTSGNIILLPVIILVAIVDRFYSYMDQSGTHAAMLRLGVTALIAIFCIPILLYEDLGFFILEYPEAHFITAAMVLLLTDYKGKKITDYKYLRLLGENKPEKKPGKKARVTADSETD